MNFIGKRTLPGRWRGRAATRVRQATTEEVLTTGARGETRGETSSRHKGRSTLSPVSVELRAHLTSISHSYLVMRRVARDILLTLV